MALGWGADTVCTKFGFERPEKLPRSRRPCIDSWPPSVEKKAITLVEFPKRIRTRVWYRWEGVRSRFEQVIKDVEQAGKIIIEYEPICDFPFDFFIM